MLSNPDRTARFSPTSLLTFSLAAALFLGGMLSPLNAQGFETKLLASDGAIDDWFGYTVSIANDRAIVGAYGDDDNGSRSGSAYIFKWNGTAWVEEAKLIASDGAADDYFGSSVSIANDWAIIGAHQNDDNGTSSGSAYIFKWNGTAWVEEVKLIASDGGAYEYFGSKVFIDNDQAIIRASGAAYIFKWNGTAWVEEAKLTASDGAGGSFGSSVSIDDDQAIIGASGDNSAYIFRWNGSTWVEEAKLTASDRDVDDRFGFAVSIDSNWVTVGAVGDADNGDNSGSAYIFKWNGAAWVEEAKFLANDGSAEDRFGWSVSIANDRAIIGTYGNDMAYIFKWNGAAWVEEANLIASDGGNYDNFGFSVSIDNDRAIIGARYDDEIHDDEIHYNSGSAYIYDIQLPATDYSTTSLAFNSVPYGDQVQQTFSVQNVGVADLIVSDMSFTDNGYSAVPDTFTLSSGQSQQVTVTFAPDSARTYEGDLVITHNGTTSPDSIHLTGTGIALIPDVALSVTSLTFPATYLNQLSSRAFTVENTGFADLVVSDLEMTSADFTADSIPFVLPPGQVQTVTVTFSPHLTGAYSELAVLIHNGPSSPDTLTLSATSLLPGAYMDYLASFTVLPSYVNVMFQVTDQGGAGLTTLNVAALYDIEENGNPISETEALPKIGQMDQVPFKVKTVLMLDNSFSIGLDLDTLKTAALAVVDNMLPNQEIAVFTFSETIVLRQDFTHDVDLLTAAINAISLGPASTNLYGAVIAGADHAPDDVFSPEQIEQSYLIILTDGQDTQGSSTLAEAVAARGTKKVITVGVGAGADANVLGQIQTIGYFPAADFSVLLQVFEDIQQHIVGLANSFYWLVYVSPTRGANEHTLEIGLKGNPNTGAKSTISVNFSSDGFSSVLPGVYVNRSFDRLNGIDSVAFEEGSASTLLTAETLFSLYTPVYEWASGNPSIITVVPVEGDPTQAVATPVGQIGQSTTITVSDVANSYSKELYAIVSTLNLTVEYSPGLPGEFTLHQNYPNPFNPSTTIQFDLQAATEVHLVVYDLLGREVVRLVSGYLEAGYRQVVWNGGDSNGREMPSGIYIARLVTPDYTRSVKMLLLR